GAAHRISLKRSPRHARRRTARPARAWRRASTGCATSRITFASLSSARMIASTYQLIATADELCAAIAELTQHAAVGFDTETTSLDPYAGRLRLVQLAAPDGRVFVIDLDRFRDGHAHKAESLAPFRALLAAPRPVKVAHNAKFDAKWTKHQLGGALG